MWLDTGPAKRHAPPLALTCILGYAYARHTCTTYHAQTIANSPAFSPAAPPHPPAPQTEPWEHVLLAGLGAYTCVSVQDWDARKRLELKQLLVDTGKAATPVGLALGGADDDDDDDE